MKEKLQTFSLCCKLKTGKVILIINLMSFLLFYYWTLKLAFGEDK
jgi:hypothetical protein